MHEPPFHILQEVGVELITHPKVIAYALTPTRYPLMAKPHTRVIGMVGTNYHLRTSVTVMPLHTSTKYILLIPWQNMAIRELDSGG